MTCWPEVIATVLTSVPKPRRGWPKGFDQTCISLASLAEAKAGTAAAVDALDTLIRIEREELNLFAMPWHDRNFSTAM